MPNSTAPWTIKNDQKPGKSKPSYSGGSGYPTTTMTYRPRTTTPPRVNPPRPTLPPRPTTPRYSYGGGDRFGGTGGSGSSGYSGHRNTIGGSSIFDRLFGNRGVSNRGGSSSNGGGSPAGSYYGDRTRFNSYPTTPRPNLQYRSGNGGYYDSHTSTDSKGNKVWTFSG